MQKLMFYRKQQQETLSEHTDLNIYLNHFCIVMSDFEHFYVFFEVILLMHLQHLKEIPTVNQIKRHHRSHLTFILAECIFR